MEATRTSSPCLDIDALKLEKDLHNSKIYLRLGLKGQTNQNPKNPKVISLISSLLRKSVERNEKLLQTTPIKDVLTVFHGSRAPTLTIQEYIDRVFKYSRCSPSCFVVALVYINRLIRSESIILTSLTVHRLLITSIMLAAKFIDEAFFNNAYYAKVGGVTTSEMNRLEMKFLFGINFRLYVNLSTFGKYCSELITGDLAHVIEEEQTPHVNGDDGIQDNCSKNDKNFIYHPTIGVYMTKPFSNFFLFYVN